LRQLPYTLPRKTETLTAFLVALALVRLIPSSAAAPGDIGAAARGAYLAAAAGCEQCHTDTKHGGRPYAGGRAFATRFGTVVAPNITPDPTTGIGNWEFGDFVAAMRWGVTPDDSRLLTIFPFPFYNRLTQHDLADLKAFLDTLAAVRTANLPDHRRPFASARNAVEVAASCLRGPWQGEPSRDNAWNRGAYLVATIGRCGDCHTPRNWLGAPDPGHFLAGAPAGRSVKATPNITPDPDTGIGSWSEDDIVTLLKDGQKPDFDFVGGAMGEIVDNTAKLDDGDRHAIAIYLKSLKPIRSGPPRSATKN
jgi:mono/diheme cytochrome c family protein